MPTLSITKTYADGNILTEADLDNIRSSIQTFFNTTGIDSSNIQAGGVSVSDIGINDDDYLEFGTGNDGRIGVTSDNLIIQNQTSNKSIAFKVNVGGTPTTMLTLDGTTGKIIDIPAADITVGSSAVNVTLLKQFVPVGMMAPYGGTSAPTGWLLCDGSAVSRTTYAALFALIASTAGSGDTATTFNLPDFRGRFLRGKDSGQARDPDASSRTAMNTGGSTGDNLFTLQADELKTHSHLYRASGQAALASGAEFVRFDANTGNGGVGTSDYAGTTETRPKNASVNYIIKY